MKSIKAKLETALGETSLRREVLPMIGNTPVIGVYYPSEKAFLATCSRTKGGPALTKDGGLMAQEAHRIRRIILETIPTAIIGFDVEPNIKEGGTQ